MDLRKAALNLRKHGISFEEASSVFADPLSLTVPDPDHSAYEYRFLTLGVSGRGRTLVVVHIERGESIRIITARHATQRERLNYEQDLK